MTPEELYIRIMWDTGRGNDDCGDQPPAEISLQWKGTEACYDFYCPCSPNEPQHRDGFFQQWFTCGESQPERDNYPDGDVSYCGRTWWLPNRVEAVEVKGKGVWPERG